MESCPKGGGALMGGWPLPPMEWEMGSQTCLDEIGGQIRTKARGNNYQPNNRKRKRTHGWIKRISTPAGIEVILRRMLKGRKSLTH
uniref:Large ribosomal subunit protein bL34m n=1 Tax=Coturnix japonica TaxID=93934 RepID=A0A8C2TFZ4_COTJA